MLEYVALEEAQRIMLDTAAVTETEDIDLMDSVNRVLAEDIYAGIDLPPFDRSPLDGYALRSDDTKNSTKTNPARLQIIAEVAAGYTTGKKLEPGTAIKVLTGAPIPSGADVVIKYEDTVEANGEVLIFAPLKENSNLVWAGEDVKKGEKLIEKGTVVTYGEIGMIAAQGKPTIKVYKKPEVAIISTGDELAEVGETLGPGKIYNSNLYAIGAAVISSGGIPVLMGVVPDRISDSMEKISAALNRADIVLTTGGVSVGDYDVIKDVFKNIGAEILYWRVAMKPGSPAVFARRGGKLLIGLSGNPAAAVITYQLMVKPLIYKTSGRKNYMLQRITAIMEDKFTKRCSQRRFLRASLFFKEGKVFASLTGKQSNGVMKSIMGCNAFVEIMPGDSIKEGDTVNVILLDHGGIKICIPTEYEPLKPQYLEKRD